MTKIYTSAAVIIPPEEVWLPIQTIRKRYDRQIRRWMPHINLFYPFRPKNQYIQLTDKFKQVTKTIAPFDICFKTFKFFKHGKDSYTLWLDPEPNEPIKSLQRELQEIVLDCNDLSAFKYGYTPHLSVGQFHGTKEFEKLFRFFQNTWEEMTFAVNEIHFIWRESSKNSPFRIGKTIPLG